MPERELHLPQGRIHAELTGEDDAPLVLGVHGLSANLRSWDPFVEAVTAAGRRLAALDLRGRGRSEITRSGTYGLDAHARDVLDAADALGADSFDVLGWSMGALIGIEVAARAPQRVRTLTLFDHAGRSDSESVEAVRVGLSRLDLVVDAPEDYVELMRERGAAQPWDEHWARYYLYELDRRADGRWTPRTDRAACEDDLDQAAGTERIREKWPALTMPVLLVRAMVTLGDGLIVPDDERDAFVRAVPHARVVELERNHFGIMTHPAAAEAVAELLAA